jgi:DNA-binding MarR family transcriptional regulator
MQGGEPHTWAYGRQMDGPDHHHVGSTAQTVQSTQTDDRRNLQQMLTRTLRQLEGDGLVLRKVHPTVPPEVEYSLTPLGQSLAQPLIALSIWVLDNIGAIQSHREQMNTSPVDSSNQEDG